MCEIQPQKKSSSSHLVHTDVNVVDWLLEISQYDHLTTDVPTSPSSSPHSPCNVTTDDWRSAREVHISPLEVVISIFLSVFIAATIVGNVLVIFSVALFTKMRTMSNFLIASLATADLLVAIFVLPISLQKEIVGHWTLGMPIFTHPVIQALLRIYLPSNEI